MHVYVHLARGDTNSIFPSAISKDGRSYNDQVRLLIYCNCPQVVYDLYYSISTIQSENAIWRRICCSCLAQLRMSFVELGRMEELFRNLFSLVLKPKLLLQRPWKLKIHWEKYQMNSSIQFKYALHFFLHRRRCFCGKSRHWCYIFLGKITFDFAKAVNLFFAFIVSCFYCRIS